VTRVERLRAGLEEPLLVTTPVNIRYLTDFESTNAALLVDESRTQLFTDFRYAEAARAVEGVELVEVERALVRGIAKRLTGTVGFEPDHLTFSGYRTLADAGLELVPRAGQVERLRAVKEEGELELIHRAAEITSEAYARLAEEPFVGRTESEVAWTLEQLMHELGAEEPSFATTVAGGPHGAVPHAHTGARVIGEGETVVVDAGAAYRGYAADCTRTFATGELPDELADAYHVCLEAQQTGLDAIQPGVTGRDADSAARDVIVAAGFGEAFGHGLGHGVGLLVHEAPTLRPESEDVLAPNNVVTVEPGIYLPGKGGIRIEDLVVVQDGGPVILTSFTKELLVVD
jgi:Xaa-Pro aminopeptidase